MTETSFRTKAAHALVRGQPIIATTPAKQRRLNMPRLFKSRRTERGKRKIEDSIDQLYTGPAAGKYGWMSAFMSLLTGQREKALSEGQRYLTASEKIQGNNLEEVACGLAVLKLIYTNMMRPEEAASTDERFESIRDQIGDVPIFRTMIEAFYELAVVYQGQDDPKSNQRAFIMACAALALSVLVYERHLPPELMERLFLLFRSLGFPSNCWGWLTRRCDRRSTDFVGLISVLIDEGMFPSETTESSEVSESDAKAGELPKDYEISRTIEQSWMSSGFSADFPISVAEGELSMRVEGLFEEFGRCLRDIGGLSPHVLLFSLQPAGTHIFVLEQDTSSEEKVDLFNRILGGTLAKYGANSVMVVTFSTFTVGRRDESLIPALGSDTGYDIHVEARDSKSYLSGIQRIRCTGGTYEFGEPVLSDTEDGSFSKFIFPAKPITEKPQQDTDPDEAEKTP